MLRRSEVTAVYVIDAKGFPQAVSVTTGDSNGSLTEVIGGDLKAGQQVITGRMSADASAGSGRATGGFAATASACRGSA